MDACEEEYFGYTPHTLSKAGLTDEVEMLANRKEKDRGKETAKME